MPLLWSPHSSHSAKRWTDFTHSAWQICALQKCEQQLNQSWPLSYLDPSLPPSPCSLQCRDGKDDPLSCCKVRILTSIITFIKMGLINFFFKWVSFFLFFRIKEHNEVDVFCSVATQCYYLSNGWSTSCDDWSSLLWMKMDSLPSTASPSSLASLSVLALLLGQARVRLVSGSEALGESKVWQPKRGEKFKLNLLIKQERKTDFKKGSFYN